jgi:hypothetical protein
MSNKSYPGRKPATRVCKHEPCDKRFAFKRDTALFCSPRCKKAHKRNRERRDAGLPEVTTPPKPRKRGQKPSILKHGQEGQKGGQRQNGRCKVRRNPGVPPGPSEPVFTLGRPARRKAQKVEVSYTWSADHVDPASPRPDPSDVQELIAKVINRDSGILDPTLKLRLGALDRAVAHGQLNRKQFNAAAEAVLQVRQALPFEVIRQEALAAQDPDAFMAWVERDAHKQAPQKLELQRDRDGYLKPLDRDPRLPPLHDTQIPAREATAPLMRPGCPGAERQKNRQSPQWPLVRAAGYTHTHQGTPTMPSVTVSTGGEPEAAPGTPSPAPQEPYTTSRMPGRRSGGEISISTSQGGEQIFEYSSGRPAPSSPSQSRAAPAPSPLTFTRNGRPVLAREASMSDVVDLGGAIGETSVGAALHNGWLAQGANGFERGEAASLKADTQADQQADTQDSEPGDDMEEQDAPVQRDLFDDQSEAVIEQLQSRHGAAYRKVESALVDGRLPDLDDVARSIGASTEDVERIVSQVAQKFTDQANQALTEMVGDADAVWNWTASDSRGTKLLKEARATLARDRSLEGFAKLSREFLVDLAKRDPAAVADGLRAGGTPARVVRGQVMIGEGKDETTLAAAFRSGLTSFKKRRGGRK